MTLEEKIDEADYLKWRMPIVCKMLYLIKDCYNISSYQAGIYISNRYEKGLRNRYMKEKL